LSLSSFFVLGSVVLFIATCVVLWRLAHVRNTTRGMVGNHSQINRAVLKKHSKDDESGIVRHVELNRHHQGREEATEVTMHPIDLATVALGLAAITLGVLVPGTAAFALPVGASLLTAGLPQVSRMFKTAADRRPGADELPK